MTIPQGCRRRKCICVQVSAKNIVDSIVAFGRNLNKVGWHNAYVVTYRGRNNRASQYGADAHALPIQIFDIAFHFANFLALGCDDAVGKLAHPRIGDLRPLAG